MSRGPPLEPIKPRPRYERLFLRGSALIRRKRLTHWLRLRTKNAVQRFFLEVCRTFDGAGNSGQWLAPKRQKHADPESPNLPLDRWIGRARQRSPAHRATADRGVSHTKTAR